MRYAYMGFFTLTDALHAGETLEHRGIHARVVRMPSAPGVSCAYGLKLPARRAEDARRNLEAAGGLRIGKTIYRREDGEAEHDLL